MLREKILDTSKPVIFYELIPPTQDVCVEEKDAYASYAIEALANTSFYIDAINIPEIHDEEEAKATARTESYVPKVDPREFAAAIAKGSSQHPFELVINHCTVHDTLEVHQQWLDETIAHYGIHNLVLVGGESNKVNYPGPSVNAMAEFIKTQYGGQLFCGGITIPTRRHPENLQWDEPARLVSKSEHGIDYFTSQILYEPTNMQNLLRDYDRLCVQRGIAPKRIFLSFAPIASRKDLEFLRWLGVDIPEATATELLKTNIGIGWRSLKIAKIILQDIMSFIDHAEICVPIGLNIEHITCRNFELSQLLVEELGACYFDFMQTIKV